MTLPARFSNTSTEILPESLSERCIVAFPGMVLALGDDQETVRPVCRTMGQVTRYRMLSFTVDVEKRRYPCIEGYGSDAMVLRNVVPSCLHILFSFFFLLAPCIS